MSFLNRFLVFFFNREFALFLAIGIFNTFISMGIAYSLYHFTNLGYYISSFVGVFVAAIIGFFMNRKYTFSSNNKVFLSIIKFFIVIFIAYIIAFSLSLRMLTYIFLLINSDISVRIIEQIAILIAQIIFTLINFTGQKIWTFKK